MGGMGWVAEDNDFIDAGILEEGSSIVGIMPINQEKSVAAIGFFFRVLIGIFNLFNTYFTIGPALLRVPDSDRL